MKRLLGYICPVLIFFPAALHALQSSLHEPVMGMVFDRSSHQVKPILGITGAARLGEPLDIGSELRTAAISAERDYVLAVRSQFEDVVVVSLRAGVVSILPIPFVEGHVDDLSLSPRGTSAVLYDRATARLQIVTGLPYGPTVSRQLSIASFDAVASLLAINDQANAVIVGFADKDGSSVYEVGSENRLIATHVTAIAFLHDTSDAIFIDRSQEQVTLLLDVAGSAVSIPLADAGAGLSHPDSVEIASDNRAAFVGSAEAKVIAAVPIIAEPHRITSVPLIACPCGVDGLHAIGQSNIFRISDPSVDPLWIFDASIIEPRVLVVPSKLEQ